MNPDSHSVPAPMPDSRVLVTGGAGFIGSHLVDALVGLGAQVVVIDDLSNGREENISSHVNAGDVEFIRASVLDGEALAQATAGCDIVFHEAALGSVPQSVEEPVTYQAVNGSGTLMVLEAAREAGVQRVVYAGSSSVYGDSPELPKVESMLPTPKSPYAVSKLMGEYWLRAYAECYGVSCVTLRYFNVFGPRQRPDSQYAAVIPAFAAALMEGRRPVVYGDGGQTRDFTYVGNIVRANLLAATVPGPSRGDVFNVACGERYSLLDVLETMGAVLGVEPNADFQPERAGDVRDSMADITAATERLGFTPDIGFRDGLAATLDALKSKAGVKN